MAALSNLPPRQRIETLAFAQSSDEMVKVKAQSTILTRMEKQQSSNDHHAASTLIKQ